MRYCLVWAPKPLMKQVAAITAMAVAASPVLAAVADDEGAAVRLNAATIARAVSAVPQPPGATDAGDWSRVAELAPGREVVITTDAMAAVRRRVVVADAPGITLIDLTHPHVPAHVTRVARDLLVNAPESLGRVADGGTVVRGRVRLAPNGIFLDGQWTGDIETLLLHVARQNVVEVREDLERSSAGLMTTAMLLVPAGAILHATSGGWRRPEPDINAGTVVGGGLLATGVILGVVALKRGSPSGRSLLVYQRPVRSRPVD